MCSTSRQLLYPKLHSPVCPWQSHCVCSTLLEPNAKYVRDTHSNSFCRLLLSCTVEMSVVRVRERTWKMETRSRNIHE